jgi:PAS domain S-box-containing protein
VVRYSGVNLRPPPNDLSARHLAKVVESSDDAIISKDLNSIIISWNQAAERLFGYTASEAIGKSIRMIIPADRQSEEDEVLARIRAGESVTHYETLRQRKDGSKVPISLTVSPIYDDTGVVVGASKIARDISERMTATLATRRLEAVVESSDDAIVTKTLDSVITSWNPAAERMFGYSEAEAIGKSVRMLIPADLQDEEDGVLAKIRAGERVHHYETTRLRKDGSLVAISLTVSPIRDGNGRVVGASKIARDITERSRLSAENLRLYGEAQEANRVKDEFLAVLSHELRTPLNAILGYSRLLRGNLLPADQVTRGLETLERNARWLTQIVDDVLDVSRIVSGKIRLDVQAVDLSAVINNAVATAQPAADAKGVRIHAVIDPRTGPVWGDPDRLQQVVWNLMSNAVKFTPKGGRVQVRLERVNSHIEIVVNDTGTGISEAFLPMVFERFRQADSGPTRKSGGLGLGLAIVRHIVEMHGGTVHAASPGEGQGATFSVALPLMIVQPPLTPKREHPVAERRDPLTGVGDLTGTHVLAIDDEADALGLLRDVLELAGATVTTASSASAALATLESIKPDAILADIGMPEMDGHDLIKAIRALPDPAVRNTPAVALTAFARSEDRTKALVSGFEMHLAKPVDPGELVASIATLVRRARSSP